MAVIMPRVRKVGVDRRITVAALIGAVAALLCYTIRVRNGDLGDFTWALYTADMLLDGRDPYGFVPDARNIPYPLPVAVLGLPLVWLPWQLAAALFVGLSSGLLAYGILRSGEAWRLFVFVSYPYFLALHYTQYTALIAAAWFFPVLAPLLVTIKPHIALPVALQRLTWRGVLVAGVVSLLSLAVYPTWPLRFLGMLQTYQRLYPVTVLPFGPFLLVAVLCWRDERARLLVCMALLPFRHPYDLVALWLIPTTRRQTLILTLLSWVGIFYYVNSAGLGVAWVVPALFLPVLLCVLLPPLRHWWARLRYPC